VYFSSDDDGVGDGDEEDQEDEDYDDENPFWTEKEAARAAEAWPQAVATVAAAAAAAAAAAPAPAPRHPDVMRRMGLAPPHQLGGPVARRGTTGWADPWFTPHTDPVLQTYLEMRECVTSPSHSDHATDAPIGAANGGQIPADPEARALPWPPHTPVLQPMRRRPVSCRCARRRGRARRRR